MQVFYFDEHCGARKGYLVAVSVSFIGRHTLPTDSTENITDILVITMEATPWIEKRSVFVFFDGREDSAEELAFLDDGRGRSTWIALLPETFQQSLSLGKIFKGFLEMVSVVAEGDDHFLDRMGDGGWGLSWKTLKPEESLAAREALYSATTCGVS